MKKPVHPLLEGLEPFNFPFPYNGQADHLLERVKAQASLLFEYQSNTSRTDDTFGRHALPNSRTPRAFGMS